MRCGGYLLGRIPSLVLDDGETLIDLAAILDWLDQSVGPARALVPAAGAARRDMLRRIALATGAIDKAGAATYERLIRPSVHRWPDWIDRCCTQAAGAIAALAAEAWPTGDRLDPGADHRRVHDPLRAHDRSRSASAGAPCDARRAVGALRGTSRIRGDIPPPTTSCRAAPERPTPPPPAPSPPRPRPFRLRQRRRRGLDDLEIEACRPSASP